MNRRDFIGIAAGAVVEPFLCLGQRLHGRSCNLLRRAGENPGGFAKISMLTGFSDGRPVAGGELGSWERNPAVGAEVEPAFRLAHQPDYDDSWWERVYLPHTWNANDGSDDIPGYFRGIGWYRKHFPLDGSLKGKRVFLEFEGVFQTFQFGVKWEEV